MPTMNRRFKMAVHFLFMLYVLAAGTEVPKIHKPWLENKPAKVLTLECKPPGDHLVYDLRLSANLPQGNDATNETLASMTRTMEKPSRGQGIEDISRVTFEGSWDRTLSLKLTLVMPLTDRDYRDYFCTASYKLKSSDDGFKLDSTRVEVDKSSSPKSSNNFKVTITEADNVTVTWQPPDQDYSKFTKAEVSMTYLDKDGGRVTAIKPLFVTNGNASMTFDAGVLLVRFHREPEGNSSISLYLNSKLCRPFCGYTCDVPYPSCITSGAHLCTCSEALPVSMTATEETDYQHLFIGFCVLSFVLLCALSGTIAIIVILVKKTKRKRTDYRLIPDKDKQENGQLGTSSSTAHGGSQHGAGGSDGPGNPPTCRSETKPPVSPMGDYTDRELNHHEGSADCEAPGGSQHGAGGNDRCGSDGRGNPPTLRSETKPPVSPVGDYTDRELNNHEGPADCEAPGGSQHRAGGSNGRINTPVDEFADTVVNNREVSASQFALDTRV